MTRLSLRQIFWRGAAGILVLAALTALAALLGGDFDETDGEILTTLGLLLLAGGAGITGLGLHERRKGHPAGLLIAVAAPICFVVVAAYVWRGFEGDGKSAGSAVLLLAVSAVVGSSLLLVRDRELNAVVVAESALLGLAYTLTVYLIWADDAGEGVAKLAAACWILGCLGWALVPVVQRARGGAQAAPDQTVAEDQVVAELEGVELVATSRPVAGDFMIESGPSGLLVHSGSGTVALPPGRRLAVRKR